MAADTMLFKIELSNGVQCELHEAAGFAGACEIAIKIEKVVVLVLAIERKNTKNIMCRPMKSYAMLIPESEESKKKLPDITPNLNDITSDDDQDNYETDNNNEDLLSNIL